MGRSLTPALLITLLFMVLKINGQTTKPCPPECHGKKMDVGLVIDASSSIYPKDFTVGLWFLQDLVDKFNIGPDEVRVAALTFGFRVYTEDSFRFGDHPTKEELTQAIGNIPFRAGNRTETGEALKDMRTRLMAEARPGVSRVVIVITDGNSQNGKKTKDEAKLVRDEGITVLAVGVGNVTLQELLNIAGDEKNVETVGSYGLLPNILERLAYKACGGKPPGPNPEPCVDSKADIAFVIDSSSSIGTKEFEIGLEFVHQFLASFNIGATKVRGAAVTFDERANEDDAFGFSAHLSENELVDAVTHMPYRARRYTNTGDGIRYMREVLMSEARPEAAHLAIVITDGQSQEWEKTYAQAKQARDRGIEMFAIGVGAVGGSGGISMEELNEIAGRGDHVFIAHDYNALHRLQATLAYKTCTAVARVHGVRQ